MNNVLNMLSQAVAYFEPDQASLVPSAAHEVEDNKTVMAEGMPVALRDFRIARLPNLDLYGWVMVAEETIAFATRVKRVYAIGVADIAAASKVVGLEKIFVCGRTHSGGTFVICCGDGSEHGVYYSDPDAVEILTPVATKYEMFLRHILEVATTLYDPSGNLDDSMLDVISGPIPDQDWSAKLDPELANLGKLRIVQTA